MNSWIPGNKSTLLTYTVSNGFAGHLLAGIPLCNNLQNVCATTYKTLLQQPTFLFCNFLQKGLAKNKYDNNLLAKKLFVVMMILILKTN